MRDDPLVGISIFTASVVYILSGYFIK